MRRRVVLALLLFAVALLSGCFAPYRPVVPNILLSDSPHEWRATFRDADTGFLSTGTVETQYRFDPPNSGPPFPGVLTAVGVRGLSRLDDQELLALTQDIVAENLDEQGVTISDQGRREGHRTLASGARTIWFSWIGTSQADAPLFAQEEEVRVLGETWYDGRSSTHVVAVAIAQTTRSSGIFLQQPVRDHSVWNELAGDPAGSVGGAIHEAGFGYHLVSHG